MTTYAEQIAQWRAQRQQQQIADARERDQAIAKIMTWGRAKLRDMECQQLEQEHAHYTPPQQQVHPQWANWIRQHSAFIEREGQRGVDAVSSALAYMQRPRNRNSNDPRYRGMGMRPEQIFTLEMHGQQLFGVRFDKNEKGLTATEAERMSGVSADR